MNITTNNYFEVASNLNFSDLPEKFGLIHNDIDESTGSGLDWSAVEASPDYKSMVELYFSQLAEHLQEDQSKDKAPTPTKKRATRKKGTTAKKKAAAKKKAPAKKKKPGLKENVEYLKDLSEELKIIKRFVGLHDKEKSQLSVRRAWNYLNRLVAKGKVRASKTFQGAATPYHEQIAWIQEHLELGMKQGFASDNEEETARLVFDEEKIAEFRGILKQYDVWPSVRLVLRYIGMQGKSPALDKVKALITAIDKATDKGQLKYCKDKTAKFMPDIRRALQNYLDKKTALVSMSAAPLNGLCGTVLTGESPVLEGASWEFTPSSDYAFAAEKEDFEEETGYIVPPSRGSGRRVRSDQPPRDLDSGLAFSGRWQQLFNRPSPGFSALVYGPPKSGKSTLCLDFAGYLARDFGRVLYASIEEGHRSTIWERVNRLGVGHARLEILDYLPHDLSGWDFVVVDSASDGCISPDMMRSMVKRWPEVSFVFLFHVTKGGLPKGEGEFQHIVDVLVEVRDGRAEARGRFGGGSVGVRFG